MRQALLKSNKITENARRKNFITYRHVQKSLLEYSDVPIGKQFLKFRGITVSSFVESKGLRYSMCKCGVQGYTNLQARSLG
jgi:hypothetical protein